MPNIVIREMDNTTAAPNPLDDYAVLLAGFIDRDKEAAFKERADAAGVVEFYDAQDFKDTAGEVPTEATAASGDTTASAPVIKTAYKWSYAKNKQGEEWQYSDTKGKSELPLLYTATQEEGLPGHLHDYRYKYEPVAEKTELEDTDIVFSLSDEGKDGQGTSIEHTSYANQMAFELLSLGYPVIYKSLGSVDVSDSLSSANKPDAINTAVILFEELEQQKEYYEELETDRVDVNLDTGGLLSGFTKLESGEFWSPLKDRAEYNFRFATGAVIDGTKPVNAALAQVVSEQSGDRGDAICLAELERSDYEGKLASDIVKSITADVNSYYEQATGLLQDDSKYVAFFAPYVDFAALRSSSETGYQVSGRAPSTRMPASFYYLACFIKAHPDYPEWFATAGYTRGVSDYTVASVGAKFGDTCINALEPRSYHDGASTPKAAVNVIATIRGQQYLWGNRTAYPLSETDLVASHFLNIRQLCTTIKKELYTAYRSLVFDPNSDVLWINFTNAILPLLDRMKANQGLRDYKIIKVPTTQRATLKARLRIVPIEAVEDFYIDISLEDQLSTATLAESANA